MISYFNNNKQAKQIANNDYKKLVPFWVDEDFIKSVLVGNWENIYH